MLLISAKSNAQQPRPEYPRPQFERSEWVNLNGSEWSYEFDFSKSGMERNLKDSKGFGKSINVPFCPESPLSGVGYKDFIEAMWYHRTLNIPQDWDGKHILLNFGGVDYKSVIYINGKEAFSHYGGSSSFSVDITSYVTPGSSNDLVVYVEDNLRSYTQAAGKQSTRLNSYECYYTRVTGIWQTVWLEAVSKGGLKSCKITPDLDNKQFIFDPTFYDLDQNAAFKVRISDGGKTIFTKQVAAGNSSIIVAQLKNVKTWSPESPHLYNVEFTVTDARGYEIDKVESYAGMRKTEVRGKMFYLNNQPYYQRLVLDQGYYPDGQWTAPTDEQLKRDIELGKEAGFNGARLHQKVFEQRYLYWADKLGYLVWGESASWGMNYSNLTAARNMLTEWEECITRDYNTPSIVAWSPLNEARQPNENGQRERLTNDLYYLAKHLDNTRPVVTVSGGYHAGFTDIYAEHTYEQDPVKLYEQLKLDENGYPYVYHPQFSKPYKGEMYVIDEFGGIRWFKEMKTEEVATEDEFWGYGKPPRTIEEFYKRLEEQVDVVLSLDHIAGFCYTQLVDVELEKNGIYTYDRALKFDMDKIRKIFTKSREQAKKEVAQMLAERQKSKPGVVAHRGYYATEGAAQNSLAALKNAQNLNLYGSETDVWLTTDGHLMINHDQDYKGVIIQNSTYDQVKDLTLSNGEKMPQLQDFLKQLTDKSKTTKLFIEVKDHNTADKNKAVVKAIVEAVKQYGVQDRVQYISFSIDNCKEILKYDPNAEVAYLKGDLTPTQVHELGLKGIHYAKKVYRDHPTWMKEANDLGMTVNVQGVNTAADAEEMLKMGADLISSDKPKEMSIVRDRYVENSRN